MDNGTQLFVDLCLAVVRQAREVTEESWRAMRDAQRKAEYKFGTFVADGYEHADVAWYAALGIAADAGAYARHGVTEAATCRAEAISMLADAHPEIVSAAREAVQGAIGGSR
jgi:hypothetical protein